MAPAGYESLLSELRIGQPRVSLLRVGMQVGFIAHLKSQTSHKIVSEVRHTPKEAVDTMIL